MLYFIKPYSMILLKNPIGTSKAWFTKEVNDLVLNEPADYVIKNTRDGYHVWNGLAQYPNCLCCSKNHKKWNYNIDYEQVNALPF